MKRINNAKIARDPTFFSVSFIFFFFRLDRCTFKYFSVNKITKIPYIQ